MNQSKKDSREYEPFGEEWINEIMKMPKKFIVEQLYKPSAMEAQSLKEENEKSLKEENEKSLKEENELLNEAYDDMSAKYAPLVQEVKSLQHQAEEMAREAFERGRIYQNATPETIQWLIDKYDGQVLNYEQAIKLNTIYHYSKKRQGTVTISIERFQELEEKETSLKAKAATDVRDYIEWIKKLNEQLESNFYVVRYDHLTTSRDLYVNKEAINHLRGWKKMICKWILEGGSK